MSHHFKEFFEENRHVIRNAVAAKLSEHYTKEKAAKDVKEAEEKAKAKPEKVTKAKKPLSAKQAELSDRFADPKVKKRRAGLPAKSYIVEAANGEVDNSVRNFIDRANAEQKLTARRTLGTLLDDKHLVRPGTDRVLLTSQLQHRLAEIRLLFPGVDVSLLASEAI
ncbi:hypothetical protein [Ochrobactrum sp. MC-1LL]|uniref:hypothetical protein n=1 Tax=Ochrobactrum sp. MC-1LL TaxID=2735351 RepID=UPI0014383260|nr:hypothetical protein [Ochrobactrum sp. MC-1LL]NKE75031.1 hypothetical protein [Ochrobactrum sp. MC-1LL]